MKELAIKRRKEELMSLCQQVSWKLHQLLQLNLPKLVNFLVKLLVLMLKFLKRTFGADAEISEKRKKINSELKNISNLTIAEVIKTVCYIASHPELIDVFFSMEEENMEPY
ncbi:hypothetical protein AAHA92_14343 [Salvia divinorum]|uniref:Uncharacterized protein n=1 Tax=Salvia divinorum TaxID=28513 RepID=A0ABD1HB92_SALDI